MENAWQAQGRDAIAIVTGANKGIGFHIARRLAHHGLTTILTARNESLGEEAVKKLREEGLESVEFHQLDIVDASSVQRFVE